MQSSPHTHTQTPPSLRIINFKDTILATRDDLRRRRRRRRPSSIIGMKMMTPMGSCYNNQEKKMILDESEEEFKKTNIHHHQKSITNSDEFEEETLKSRNQEKEQQQQVEEEESDIIYTGGSTEEPTLLLLPVVKEPSSSSSSSSVLRTPLVEKKMIRTASPVNNMEAGGGEDMSGRERLKRHRVEMAGRVWIPDMWGQEDLLKDWIDFSAFDASLMNSKIMLARAALSQEGRRATSTTIRIENGC